MAKCPQPSGPLPEPGFHCGSDGFGSSGWI